MIELARAELARYIDHTLLKPEAIPADIRALAVEAVEFGVHAICIPPSTVRVATAEHLGTVQVASVCGFPSGQHLARVKASEAAGAVGDGATEIDMVIDLGALRCGRTDLVAAEIRAVRAAVPHIPLKVIIESAVLTDAQIVTACRTAERAGADFVKTSTGFHPAGGASLHSVRLMRQTVGDRLGVKASGGIRDYASAIAMIEAGATRLGMSATARVLAEAG